MSNSKNQQGFSVVELLLILVVLLALGFVGFKVAHKNKSNLNNTQPSSQNQNQAKQETSDITWMQTADGYQPNGTPPNCNVPIVTQFPADIAKATAVLYPGQLRGGNYKPHGGLRFDKSTNDQVTVKATFDGTVIDGAAYLADGEVNDVQYTFDFMNSCGMMYRLGHLLKLSPQFAEIAKAFPEPKKNDSRTTPINPGVKIKAGTVIATAVGTSSDKNVFFDWGIYDWRQPNEVSKNASWLQDSRHDNALAKHAICWFDQLSSSDKSTVKSLPAGDPISGKTSDYCK